MLNDLNIVQTNYKACVTALILSKLNKATKINEVRTCKQKDNEPIIIISFWQTNMQRYKIKRLYDIILNKMVSDT